MHRLTGFQLSRNLNLATCDVNLPLPNGESRLLNCNCVLTRSGSNRGRGAPNKSAVKLNVGSCSRNSLGQFALIVERNSILASSASVKAHRSYAW